MGFWLWKVEIGTGPRNVYIDGNEKSRSKYEIVCKYFENTQGLHFCPAVLCTTHKRSIKIDIYLRAFKFSL